MSGRSYTPVELPKETLEDIQRKTDAAMNAVRSRLKQVTMETEVTMETRGISSGQRFTKGKPTMKAQPMTTARVTAASVSERSAVLQKELASAGETVEARQRLQHAAAQAAPQPTDERAERKAVARYEAEEARALDELRAAKARQMRLVEVATALADSRPRGVEVVTRCVGKDGSVTLTFARGTDRRSRVDVTVAAKGDKVEVGANALAAPIAVDGRAGAVCAGLDQVFAPILDQARATGRLRTGPTQERRMKVAAMDLAKRAAKRATRSSR
jgi:hypothetical protein